MEMRVHRWIFIGKILAENDAIIILSYECLTGIPGRAGGGCQEPGRDWAAIYSSFSEVKVQDSGP